MTQSTTQIPLPSHPGSGKDAQLSPFSEGIMHGMSTRQFVIASVRQLAPSLFLSIACTVILYRVMCELKEFFGPRRVWVLMPCLPTGGRGDDTELRGLVPDAVCAD